MIFLSGSFFPQGIYLINLFIKNQSFIVRLDMSYSALEQNRSSYNRLLYEAKQKVTYQNVCGLALRVVILGFSTFYFGYCLTYFSTFSFNPKVSSEVLDIQGSGSTIDSVLKGILPIGAMAGAATAPLFMRFLTRKQFILTINILAIIIEGIIQITNVYVLLGCRLVQGFIIGNNMALVPIYINQLAPKQIVGSFGVFAQLMVVVGVVFSYGIGLILNAADVGPYAFYHTMVSLNAITIIIQSILLIVNFIPQSPNSLILKNRNDQARQVVGMFTLPQFIDEAIRQKQLIVRGQQKSNDKQQQTIKYATRAYILGFQLPFMQQLTGTNAIVTSATIIVSGIPSLEDLTNVVPLILNVAQLVATIGTVAVLTRVGRKPLTLIGNLSLALVDIAMGILFVFQKEWAPSGIFIFVLLIIYNLIYGISLGPVVWLYVPEIVPSKVVPLATIMNWFGCSLCVIFTPIVINLNGGNPASVFFFFGGITLLFFIMNTLFMVQTKDKSKQEISRLFLKQD